MSSQWAISGQSVSSQGAVSMQTMSIKQSRCKQCAVIVQLICPSPYFSHYQCAVGYLHTLLTLARACQQVTGSVIWMDGRAVIVGHGCCFHHFISVAVTIEQDLDPYLVTSMQHPISLGT